jgi:2-polyprenyl-3-methyl-5-hydroxy-6-metoxy-1,4-benzoquinol methylase
MTSYKSIIGLAARVASRVPYASPALRRVGIYERTAANITRENTLAAYDRVYSSDRLLGEYLGPERLQFYEELATILAPLAPRSVVDIGCGTGHLLRFIVERMSRTPQRIVGIDHSGAGLRRARELLPSATWLVDDIHDLSLDERFHLVLCTEVLEHVKDPEHVVRALRVLCATDGTVAITVPDGAHDTWEGHVNFWDEDELRAFLTPHGLERIERIDRGNTLLAWLTSGE